MHASRSCARLCGTVRRNYVRAGNWASAFHEMNDWWWNTGSEEAIAAGVAESEGRRRGPACLKESIHCPTGGECEPGDWWGWCGSVNAAYFLRLFFFVEYASLFRQFFITACQL